MDNGIVLQFCVGGMTRPPPTLTTDRKLENNNYCDRNTHTYIVTVKVEVKDVFRVCYPC